MKRTALLVLMLASVFVYGQKPVKPNLNKAIKAFQEGKLDEAKAIIDVTSTSEKTMNDGKTWYYKGLIYASIDTTKNEAYKGLADDAFQTALASFEKADQLAKSGSDEYSYTYPNSVTTLTKSQQLENWANFYLDKSIKILQEGDDYNASVAQGEKTIKIFENGLKKWAILLLIRLAAIAIVASADVLKRMYRQRELKEQCTNFWPITWSPVN